MRVIYFDTNNQNKPLFSTHKSHPQISFNLIEIKSIGKSYWLLPGSCQNKENTKIKCLNGPFGVTTATRTASLWLGRDCARGSTPLEGCHDILLQVLLSLCVVLWVLKQNFQQVLLMKLEKEKSTSTTLIWCLFVHCLYVDYLFKSDPLKLGFFPNGVTLTPRKHWK